jgi:hypothetical protein
MSATPLIAASTGHRRPLEKLALFKVVSITYKYARLMFIDGDQPATGISISRIRISNVRSAT